MISIEVLIGRPARDRIVDDGADDEADLDGDPIGRHDLVAFDGDRGRPRVDDLDGRRRPEVRVHAQVEQAVERAALDPHAALVLVDLDPADDARRAEVRGQPTIDQDRDDRQEVRQRIHDTPDVRSPAAEACIAAEAEACMADDASANAGSRPG